MLGLFCMAVFHFNPNLKPNANALKLLEESQSRTEFDIAMANVFREFGEILRGYKDKLGETQWPNFYYRLQPPEVTQGLAEFYKL